MIPIALGIFAGMGLFFIGMRLLSVQLKEVTGDRVRVLAARMVRSRPLMMMLGAAAGAATQSTNAVTAAATGLATANIIGIRDAFPLIACANIGTSVLVFLAASSLHDIVLGLIASCGLLYIVGLDRRPAWRKPVATYFALVLMLLGLDLLESHARALRDVEFLREILSFATGQPLIAFLIGAALVPFVQTAKTVAAIVTVLVLSTVMDPLSAIAAVIGANTTSALNVIFLTARISPIGRTLAFYQALLKVIGSAAAILAVTIAEIVAPGWLPALTASAPALSVAVAYLIIQTVAYTTTLPFEPALERRLQRMVTAAAEDPARPRYISPEALSDPASATELAFREHLDILDELPRRLDPVRADTAAQPRPLRDLTSITRAVDAFLEALDHSATDQRVRRRIASLQRLNGLLGAIDEQVVRLVAGATRPSQHPMVAGRIAALLESADFILQTLYAVAGSDDPIDRQQFTELAGDRTSMMEELRLTLMSEIGADSASQRDLFEESLAFERMIWLARRYDVVALEPDSPFRDATHLRR